MWAVVLDASGLCGLWLLTRKHRAGFLVGAGAMGEVMGDTITVPQLDPDMSEDVCSALRTWAPVLGDFHAALVSCHLPADCARELTLAFWDRTLEAGYMMDRTAGDDE